MRCFYITTDNGVFASFKAIILDNINKIDLVLYKRTRDVPGKVRTPFKIPICRVASM